MRIAIAGAGIGGMSLAAILSRLPSKPIVDVFERDSRDRDQGTGFDVSSKGQEVLKKAGVYDKYWEFSRRGSDIMKTFTADSDRPLAVLTQPKLLQRWFPPTPESNRQLMRDALIDVLGPNANVHFDCGVSGVRGVDARAEIISYDQKTVLGTYDIIVDASGFNSPLRKYRIKEEEDHYKRLQSFYTGRTMIHGLIQSPEDTCNSKIVQQLGQGTVSVIGPNGKFLTLQRYGAHEQDRRTSCYYTVAAEAVSSVADELGLERSTQFHKDEEKLNKIKNWVLKDMQGKWSTTYTDCINQFDSASIRPIFQHPAKPNFIDDSLPLICIGDALHVVPPYTGSGGNLALEDASDVAEFFENNQTIEIPALRKLELSFLNRAEPKMKTGEKTARFMEKLEKYDDLSQIPLRKFLGTPMAMIVQVMKGIYYTEKFLGIRDD